MENDTSSLMNIIIWSGAALSFLGLLGLVWCILRVGKAKRDKLDDAAMHKVVQNALPMNLGSLFLSAIGLMMVVVGIFLS